MLWWPDSPRAPAYLGIDLLYQWLWVERKRLPWLEYGVIVTILVVAVSVPSG